MLGGSLRTALGHRSAQPVLVAEGADAARARERAPVPGWASMPAIASRGALWFTVLTRAFDTGVFIHFLDRLARQAERKIHVIAGRHPAHGSKKLTAWPACNRDRTELHSAPTAAPI